MILAGYFLGVVACFAGYGLGEIYDKKLARIPCMLGAVLLVACGAVGFASIFAFMSIGIPVSESVSDYVEAAHDQLAAGNASFVADQFEMFDEQVQVTYETGLYVEGIKAYTETMRAGPSEKSPSTDPESAQETDNLATEQQHD